MIHAARSMAGRRAGPLLALLLLGLATARAEPVDGLPLRAFCSNDYLGLA
ncbi:8-amino-7-oxononanoate synthase, partial [Pseudomonas aeruginosa]|nr:8-amino-7-oxononanoate synthase [Pseudomonas aeruginosa]